MHHHRIDSGLLQQHDVARERARHVLVAHGVAAVLDDDGFLVVALHVRQRLGEDPGGVERICHAFVIHDRSREPLSAAVLADNRAARERQLPGFGPT
jgi:hypothetical protein